MKWLWISLLTLGLTACTDGCDNSTTGPDIPPATTTTTTTVEPDPTKPPRIDQRVDIWNVRGCTNFGAAALNEQELVALVAHNQAAGCRIMRVGAQTDGWETTSALYLLEAVGPPVLTAEWEVQLEQLLDVTARMGMALQLIPTFTHKHEHFDRNLKITKRVVGIQQAGSEDDPTPYKHIVWEAWNEVKHPITHSTNRDFSNIKQMLTYLKNTTGLPVGTDYDVSGGRHDWTGEYPRTLLNYVDYIAFHPPRNDMDNGCEDIRPTLRELRRTVNSYSKPVWIDEPTCYISDESKSRYGITKSGHYSYCGGKTETARRKHIGDYAWDTEQAGAIWFSHTSWGFAGRRLGWLP
ncbi:MAG: hypothetical protein ACXAEN_23975 [Candidatus Thorarchaeota archaeon]|jgi:hypothetical protein